MQQYPALNTVTSKLEAKVSIIPIFDDKTMLIR